MSFNVLNVEVSALFKNDSVYNIPRYQRGYVWNEVNWEQLLRDIRYCSEVAPNWSHFIGSMVFEEDKDDHKELSIIDGQQRIMTLQVVIFALIYCYLKLKASNDELADDCDNEIKYLSELIITRKPGEKPTYKINLNGNYDDFKTLNYEASIKDSKKLESHLNSRVNSKKKFFNAFKYFVKDFEQLSYDELEKINKNILKTQLITISSSQEEEVCNIFEILNARGVQLRQVELLKNFLFKYLKPENLKDEYKEKWNKMESDLCEIDLDDYYFHLFKCWNKDNKVKQSELFEKTKDSLIANSNNSIKDFYDIFLDNSNYYLNIVNIQGTNEEKDVYEFFRIIRNKQARSVLMAIKNRKELGFLQEEKYNELLYMIRNFYVAFNIEKNMANKIDLDISSLAHRIFISDDQNIIEYHLLSFVKKHSSFIKEDVFQKGLTDIIYSNKSERWNINSAKLVYLLKPILLKCDSGYLTYDFNDFNIEHILNDEVDNNIRYELGNLLLCHKKLNKKLKNKPYEEKRGIYLECQIPYIVSFANEYETFTESDINKRTGDVSKKVIYSYLIDENKLSGNLDKLQKYSEVKKKLESEKIDSQLISILKDKGLDRFEAYVINNANIDAMTKQKVLNIIDSVNS